MSWYENNKKFDIDVSKIQPRGALASKAIGDSFKDIAQIIDDREKTNMEKEKAEQEKVLKAYEIDEKEDKKIDRKATRNYGQFIDPKTGKFNEEGFKQAYGEDKLKNVPLSVRQNRYNIENAYNTQELGKKMGYANAKAQNQEEFNNILAEDLKNIDYDNSLKATNRFDKLRDDEAKLKNEREKQETEKNNKKSRPAADYSLVYKVIVNHYGGFYDPDTGKISGLDPQTTKKVTRLLANAGKLLRENPDLSTAEAPEIVIEENAKIQATKEAKPEDLRKQQEAKQNLTKADNKELVADKERLNKMLNLK